MKKMNKKGFTIVELTIVIAVIAILSAVLIPTFSGVVKKSKNTAAIQGAQTAYTEYLSEVKYENGEEPAEYMIYQASSERFVAFNNGNIVLATGDIPFTTSADAMKAILDDPATANVNEADNYELEDTISDGALVAVVETQAP